MITDGGMEISLVTMKNLLDRDWNFYSVLVWCLLSERRTLYLPSSFFLSFKFQDLIMIYTKRKDFTRVGSLIKRVDNEHEDEY